MSIIDKKKNSDINEGYIKGPDSENRYIMI